MPKVNACWQRYFFTLQELSNVQVALHETALTMGTLRVLSCNFSFYHLHAKHTSYTSFFKDTNHLVQSVFILPLSKRKHMVYLQQHSLLVASLHSQGINALFPTWRTWMLQLI